MCKTLKVLILALVVTGCAGLGGTPPPDISKYPSLGQQFGQCPDGSVMSVEVLDADSTNPMAAIYVFRRGPDQAQGLAERVVAILDRVQGTIWIAKERKVYTLADAQAKWRSPCDLPDPGIST